MRRGTTPTLTVTVDRDLTYHARDFVNTTGHTLT